MKCPYCGADLGSGDRCEYCNSKIPYEMRKELEKLNMKGCPNCKSTNISFRREEEGETWSSGSKRYLRRTVGLCHDCGYTWYTSLPEEPVKDPSGNIYGGKGKGEKDSFPFKKLTVPIVVAVLVLLFLINPFKSRTPEDIDDNDGIYSGDYYDDEEGFNLEDMNLLQIEPLAEKSLTIQKAEVEKHKGQIKKEDQDDIYSFTPQRDGVYRLDISGLHNNGIVFLDLYDAEGRRLSSGSAENGEGLTLSDLKKNRKYKIHVSYFDGFTPYTLSIGKQKEKKDISDYSSVKDSIEFIEQDNRYVFTAHNDGTYRFEFAGIHNDLNLGMSLENDLGERLQFLITGNEEGLTLPLKKGNKYTLHIFESEGISPYELKIGKQKPVADITDYDGVQDSIEFNNQDNIYLYKPSESREYEFHVCDLKENARVSISVYNRLEERVAFGFCDNNSFVSGNLKAGESYMIHVEYDTGYSSYSMFIQ